MNPDKINAYQHVRNKNCIYQRVGNTDIFVWNDCKRSEQNIKQEIVWNNKFIPIKITAC